jgi:hypothetical protein
VFIPIGEFTPDQPDFMNPGSSLVQNLLPRTAQSYGPFPGITAVATAITARCQGAYSMIDTSGNARLFAGDASKLYRMDPSLAAPGDVSKVGGYTTGTTERWAMALFGSRVMATNYTDPPQSYIEGSSSVFADMITSGQTDLKARYIAVVRDWVVFGNTTDGTFGPQPQRVWWCGIDDPTNFPTPGTTAAAAVQSDYQDLVGDFGWVQGVVGNLGTSDGAIIQERGVWRMQYVGPSSIFAFSIAEGARGTPAPGSIVQLSDIAYYLGEDGFYAFDGTNSDPIGFGKIDKTFFSDMDQSYFYRVTSTIDPINKLVLWAYPGAGHSGGNPNRILAYHWVLKRWTITAANDIQIEVLFRSLSFGYTLEQLDTPYPNLDTMPVSLDSRVLTGGRSILAAFDTSHRYSQFTGSNLAVTAQTSEAQPNPKGRMQIDNARPLVDGGTPSVSIGTRNRLSDALTYTTPVAMDANGSCPQRAEGRYLRGQITLPVGSSFTHLQGIEVPDDEVAMTGTTR